MCSQAEEYFSMETTESGMGRETKRDLAHFGGTENWSQRVFCIPQPLLQARAGSHTFSRFAGYKALLSISCLQESMDEVSQTPSGYPKLNHMQKPQTLQHLLADKTALSRTIYKSIIFSLLYRDFTHRFCTDSHKHCTSI